MTSSPSFCEYCASLPPCPAPYFGMIISSVTNETIILCHIYQSDQDNLDFIQTLFVVGLYPMSPSTCDLNENMSCGCFFPWDFKTNQRLLIEMNEDNMFIHPYFIRKINYTQN